MTGTPNTPSMIIAMKPTVELPPCQRRWINGDKITCKVPPRPPGMSSKDYLKYRRREVSCDVCLACTEVLRPAHVMDQPKQVNPLDVPMEEEVGDPREPKPADVLSDGTLVYPKDNDPPGVCPPGYKPGVDDWTFERVEPYCDHIVLKSIRKSSCECIQITLYCTRNGKSEVVTEAGCAACPKHSSKEKPVEKPKAEMPKIVVPEKSKAQLTHKRPRLLANGVIAYPMKGWEPPAVPHGYRRKSDNLRSADAWVFIPIMEHCKHRKREITYTPCGNATVTHTCGKKDFQSFGSRVVTFCNTCPEREE